VIEAAHQTASFERRDWWRGTGQRGKAKKGRQIGVNITGARRIMSTRVGSDRLRKFSTSPDSSIAYQERVLTLTDRLCPDLTMELLQFYYSQIARGRVRALPGAPSGTGQRREWQQHVLPILLPKESEKPSQRDTVCQSGPPTNCAKAQSPGFEDHPFGGFCFVLFRLGHGSITFLSRHKRSFRWKTCFCDAQSSLGTCLTK
jgi:hypothetical protein